MLIRRLALLTPLLILAAACGGDRDVAPTESGREHAMGHIHGIGVDPADGTVFVATHFGVFRLQGDEVVRVADRWQDTMAFTVVGERHFLGSGHPDLREDLPAHLGLIESTDGGETWHALALQGEADFHALESTDDVLYAYDAVTGTLMSSTDRRSFSVVTRIGLADIAATPTDSGKVMATTEQGLVSINAASGKSTPIPDSPVLAFIDWPQPDLLVGLAPDGGVNVSEDAGATWIEAGRVPGRAAALEVTAEAWYAATDTGLYESRDRGATWQLLQAVSE